MINWFTNLILTICFGVKQLAVVLVSMVPIIELKGGIPIGVKLGLGYWESFAWALLGSCLVCIPLLLLFPLLFKWSVFKRIKEVFQNKADKVSPKWKIFGVFLFVAIPIPGTGVWTGSIVAVILGLRFFPSLGIIVLGNLVSALAIIGLTALFGAHLDLFLFILFCLFIILLAVFLYKVFTVNKDGTKT